MLPDFPVDDETLDLVMAVLDAPADEHGRFPGLSSLLDGLSDDGSPWDVLDHGVVYVGERYSHDDVIRALIAEVRRLRVGSGQDMGHDDTPPDAFGQVEGG